MSQVSGPIFNWQAEQGHTEADGGTSGLTLVLRAVSGWGWGGGDGGVVGGDIVMTL